MALRTIVQDGDPILKKVCRPVTKFDDRLVQLPLFVVVHAPALAVMGHRRFFARQLAQLRTAPQSQRSPGP